MARSHSPLLAAPLHVHDDAAEAFTVLEGEDVIFLGDVERVCPAGSSIHVPAGVEHVFRVGRVQSRDTRPVAPCGDVGYWPAPDGCV